MSDHKPITGELRATMCKWGWVERDGSIMFTTSPIPTSIDAERSLVISGGDFDRLCDAIDAIHAQLERENAALRERLVERDNRGGSRHIGEATVAVTPTLDWSGVAHELRAIADTFAFSHHHAPTVEDVLREMADRCYADEDEPRDRDAIVAEYAAKLRLAESE